LSARAQAAAVAPVVITSSINKTRLASSRARLPRAEGASHIPPAPGDTQPGLRGGRPHTQERAANRDSRPAGHAFGQQMRLVETPVPAAAPVQRHEGNNVEALIERERRGHPIGQHPGKRLDARVFKKVDQLPEGSFVGSEAVGRIEAAQTGAAKRAPAVPIERKRILKRRPAARAEVFGLERFGAAKTGGTNGNARNLA